MNNLMFANYYLKPVFKHASNEDANYLKELQERSDNFYNKNKDLNKNEFILAIKEEFGVEVDLINTYSIRHDINIIKGILIFFVILTVVNIIISAVQLSSIDRIIH
jgi:hypothetical protein